MSQVATEVWIAYELLKWLSEAELNACFFCGRLPDECVVNIFKVLFLSARDKRLKFLGEEMGKYTDKIQPG